MKTYVLSIIYIVRSDPPALPAREGLCDSMRRVSLIGRHVRADSVPSSAASADPEYGGAPELVPRGFEGELLSMEWAENALEWMGQKDALGQVGAGDHPRSGGVPPPALSPRLFVGPAGGDRKTPSWPRSWANFILL